MDRRVVDISDLFKAYCWYLQFTSISRKFVGTSLNLPLPQQAHRVQIVLHSDKGKIVTYCFQN